MKRSHDIMRRTFVSLVVAVAFLAVIPLHLNAQATEDVVYLRDGSIVRGTIVEQRVGESILIQTREGNIFRYTIDRINRIVKEPVGAVNTTSAPYQAPAPQQQFGQMRGRKSAGTAVLLSFLITGAGQFYNSNPGLGAGLLLTQLVSAPFFIDGVVTCYDEGEQCGVATALGVIFFGAKIVSIIEAGSGSRRYNERWGLAKRFVPQPTLDVVALRSGEGPRLGVKFLRATF